MNAYARPLLLANLVMIWMYIQLWQGAQRFYIESLGTWIMSPMIYARICPMPYKHDLIRMLANEPFWGHLMCAVPMGLFAIAIALGTVAFRRRSFAFAVAACSLMSSIFVVYHSVKHMGLTLVS